MRAEGEPASHGFTITLNVVYDKIMPTLGDSAWKILSFLIRRIDGHDAVRDGRAVTITLGEIERGTGKSRNTVKADLVKLAAADCIRYVPQAAVDGKTQPACIVLTIPRFVSSKR